MGFFKDFKEDFSQAVNELMPGEDALETTGTGSDFGLNTLEGEVDVKSELSKLDGLLEQVTKPETSRQPLKRPIEMPVMETPAAETTVPQRTQHVVNTAQAGMADRLAAQTPVTPAPALQTPVTPAPSPKQEKSVPEELAVITEGTVINGDIISNGSLDIRGQVNGNVSCNGKLTITGVVNGNSNAAEFYADAAQIEGEVVSTGTVKIGLGSVIIGNISSSSAVIAGAVKGDIDVQGPVVVDTSAVVMGNIKSRSVQINNGAVIEGFCSQCYAEVDVQNVFGAKKGM